MENIQLIMIGILFVFIGISIIITGAMIQIENTHNDQSSHINSKISMIGLIGPIPIIISNNKEFVQISLIAISVILFIFAIYLKYFKLS